MRPEKRLTPEVADQWVRIFRDFLISTVAAILLIWQGVWAHPPDEKVIGAALVLFGVIPALRFDEKRRGNNNDDG